MRQKCRAGEPASVKQKMNEAAKTAAEKTKPLRRPCCSDAALYRSHKTGEEMSRRQGTRGKRLGADSREPRHFLLLPAGIDSFLPDYRPTGD